MSDEGSFPVLNLNVSELHKIPKTFYYPCKTNEVSNNNLKERMKKEFLMT